MNFIKASLAFALIGSVAAPAVHAQGSGPLPPLVLLHGYNDASWRWNDAVNYLVYNQGFIWHQTPQLPTRTQSISAQANGVATQLAAGGSTFENTLAIGHSMGGLVARELSTQRPQKVVMTIGSPHQGHPTLDPVHLTNFWSTIFALTGANQTAFENLYQCDAGDFGPGGEWFNGPCYTIWEFSAFVGGLVQLVNAVRQTYFPGPAIDQLAPTSGFLSSFNGATHVAAEQAVEKISLVGMLHSWEVNSSLFRIAEPDLDPEAAAAVGALTIATGFLLYVDAMQIVGDADMDNPFYEDLLDGAGAVAFAGALVGGMNLWYNQLIGGWPNDGFMPWWTQTFPNADDIDVVGEVHTKEPSNSDLLTAIVDAGNRYRLP